MFYLSDIIGKKITDRRNNLVARIRDLVAQVPEALPGSDESDGEGESRPPIIKGLIARTARGQPPFYLRIEQVELLEGAGAQLLTSKVDLEPFERREGEILLTRDMWDKQVIDLHTRKVVRVNDVLIGEAGQPDSDAGTSAGRTRWVVRGVDIGISGLLRRLHMAGLARTFKRRPAVPRVVQWHNLDFFGTVVPGGLELSHKKLASLHPVDIARITDSVSYHQGAEIISSLDDTLAADTLEEIDEERQTDIVEQIPEERAAHIIEEMSPEDATDLLADLPEETADALLEHMDDDEAEELRQLMRYPEHSAGGIMTTDFVRALPDMTVQEVIEANREAFSSTDLIYYIYVMDPEDDRKLAGVITVRDLLFYQPETVVRDFMIREYLSVRPGEREEEVARKMAEYNLIALPVVDALGVLHGVVTVDDALDAVLPEGWKKRLPRIFR